MLSIPYPCNEDFDKMTPTERGAFCDKCAIDTFDFRKKSNEEILQTLTQVQGHKCGRFYEDQIDAFNRYQNYQDNPVKRKWTSVYAAAILAGVFAVSCTQDSDVLSEELSAERKHLAIFRDSETMVEMENAYVSQEEMEIMPLPWDEIEVLEEEPIWEWPIYECSYDYTVEFEGTDSAIVLLEELRVVDNSRRQLSGDLINPDRTLGGVPVHREIRQSKKKPGFFKRLFSKKNKD